MTKMKLVAEPGKHDILMTREFNAPRELIFRAMTEPALVARWWGQDSATTIVDRMEAIAGGSWRYIQRDAEGNEYAFRGVYHDVQAPERMIYTFEFEGMPGHVMLETITLEEQNGITTIIDSVVFQTVEDRDGMLPGMEEGANESWDRMERLLRTM